ncbi:hypothetical protein CR513_60078, partial [Mucuna pruriens]
MWQAWLISILYAYAHGTIMEGEIEVLIVHIDYQNVVKKAWKQKHGRSVIAPDNMHEASIQFNQEDIFSNIFRRKIEFEAKLKRIQCILERVDVLALVILEQQLQ